MRAAAGLLLVFAALFAASTAAQAQTVQTLVSNTGQDRDNSNLNVGGSTGWVQAQGFTTGDNTDGYTLSSVDVFFQFGFGSGDEVTVSIYGADASGNPGSSLHVLNNPSSIPNADQINSFAAPGNVTLAHGTNYFVVVEASAGAFFLAGTDFDDEDSGNASGWSINDDRSVNSQTATDWSEWEVALLIAVKGTVNGGGTASTDATLSALALSGVTLAPTFVSSTETYTATVVNSVMQTTVTATTAHSGATVALKYGDDTALTNPATLAVGANVIKAVVTAEDTTTMKTYMVTVTREDTTTLSTDASLSNLVLTDNDDNAVDLDPAFASTTRFYRATVKNGVNEITVDPTRNDTNATYEIQGKGAVELTDANDVKAGFQVALAVGEKVIRVKVTAEDGIATRSYKVDVNRALAAPRVTPTQGSTTSLDVSWTAPAAETTVVGYDVQYREGDQRGLQRRSAGRDRHQHQHEHHRP